VLGLLSALLDGAGLSTLRKGTARIRIGASLQSGKNSGNGPRNNSVRILVAAPSNAAVDELVVRVVSEGLVDGSTGKSYRPRMVRVGRPESVSSNSSHLHISNEREASAAKKTRGKMRKYAAEVEDILLETQVARQKASFGTARAARQAIVRGAQIVFCTLSGAGSVALCDFAHEFDALIIDEAAQAVEASALIPFKFRPHRAILVGDHRQLPATVLSKRLVAIGYDRSLFQRLVENGSRVRLLTRQYRMHPDIARFPSTYFYGGKLVQDPQLARSTARAFHAHALFRPLAFIDVAGGEQSQVSGSTSLRNLSEVELVVLLVRSLLRRFPELEWKKTIGVIAPYKQQIFELGARMAQLERELDVRLGIEVNTVDGFQGREKDIIIYSCVRTSAGGRRKNQRKNRAGDVSADAFWADERRMNVAITRARSSLWILGNSRLLEQSAAWRALIKDTRGRRAYFSDEIARKLLLPPTVKGNVEDGA
jgi:senataxin